MSKLQHYSRPLVEFDVGNSVHRSWFAEFQKTGSWARCPVRFYVADEVCIDLPTQLAREVSQYYSSQEFGNTVR